MACYLAPEKPCHSSSISEDYFRRLAFPRISLNSQHCRFSEQYEGDLCFCLATHAEINCTDRLCVIADESQWASIIQDRLFLNQSVRFLGCHLHPGWFIRLNFERSEISLFNLFRCDDRTIRKGKFRSHSSSQLS